MRDREPAHPLGARELGREASIARLELLERGYKSLNLAAEYDGLGDVVQMALAGSQLALEGLHAGGRRAIVAARQLGDGLLDGARDHRGVEQVLLEGLEQRPVRRLHGQEQPVLTDRGPLALEGRAPVGVPAAVAAMATGADAQASAADAADGEARQEKARLLAARRPPDESAGRGRRVLGPHADQAGLDTRPEILGDHAQRGRLHADQFGRLAPGLALAAPPIALPGPVVEHHAVVELATEQLADARRRPSARVIDTPRPWSRGTLGIQLVSDGAEARAGRVALEDAADDDSFRVVPAALDVAALAVRAEDGHVVVAEHEAASDVAGLRLAQERVTGLLTPRVAFQLLGETRRGEPELDHGRVERDLPRLAALALEHADAGDGELLQDVGRLELLAADAGIVSASVQARIALGARSGARVRRLGDGPTPRR